MDLAHSWSRGFRLPAASSHSCQCHWRAAQRSSAAGTVLFALHLPNAFSAAGELPYACANPPSSMNTPSRFPSAGGALAPRPSCFACPVVDFLHSGFAALSLTGLLIFPPVCPCSGGIANRCFFCLLTSFSALPTLSERFFSSHFLAVYERLAPFVLASFPRLQRAPFPRCLGLSRLSPCFRQLLSGTVPLRFSLATAAPASSHRRGPQVLEPKLRRLILEQLQRSTSPHLSHTPLHPHIFNTYARSHALPLLKFRYSDTTTRLDIAPTRQKDIAGFREVLLRTSP